MSGNTDTVHGTSDKSAKPSKTAVAQMGTLTLLTRSDGSVPTGWSQGKFGPGEKNSRLGVDSVEGKPRTIQSSGCGLCSLVVYFGAARLCVPSLDRSNNVFMMANGVGEPITPGLFNRFLMDCIEQEAESKKHRQELIHKVYAPDGCGALLYRSSKIVEYIDTLITHNCAEKPFRFCERIDAYAPPGKDIPQLTAHLDTGEPAIIGVAFSPSGPPAHQVLCVGYGRVGDKVYYPIVDSGFGPVDMDPLAKLSNPVSAKDIRAYSACEFRHKAYHKIVWVMPLSGLASITGLLARTDWNGAGSGAS